MSGKRRSRSRNRSRGRSGRSLSRRSILLLAGSAGVGLATLAGAGAFSSVGGNRDVDVDLANDPNAFLAIEELDSTATSGESLSVLELTNQFSEALTSVTVSVTTPGKFGLNQTDANHPGSLDVGETGTVSLPMSCDSTVTDTVDLRIIASGQSSEIKTTRSLSLTCNPASKLCDFSTPFIRGGGSGKPPDQGDQPPEDMETETGTVSVTRDQNGSLDIQINMSSDDGKELGEVHIDVQSTADDFPNGLGQYYVSESFDSGKTSYSKNIQLDNVDAVTNTEDIVIAIHGALANHDDSAWAKGPFQGHNWRMYVTCDGTE